MSVFTSDNSNHIESPGGVARFDATFVGGQSHERSIEAADSPSQADDPWLGKQLHEYIVQSLLGCGGMGRVYLARHRWLDMPVAIKLLNSQHDASNEAMERFRREARVAAKLRHPNIVRATDGGPINDSFFLVTEYLDGIDLSRYVQNRGPLPISDACWLIREAARGLDHAHQQTLVHRDIKPSNLMLTRQGELKLLDLGLARAIDSNSQLTSTGTMMGTIDYIAPEQAADTRAVDPRSDIYSLGCTLYFLLAGKPPYDGEAYDTVVSKILAHTSEEAIAIQTVRPDVPAELQRLLDQMMAKSPADRIQSASEIVQRLEPWAEVATIQTPAEEAEVVGSAPVSQSHPLEAKGNSTVDDFADAIWHGLWLVTRTFLLAIGLLERQASTSSSRLNTKTNFTYHFSPKGIPAILSFMALAGFLFVVFGGVEIIVGAP